MKSLRPLLLQFHRWSGIATALWLFVAALTGILLVFEKELDTALNPEFYTPKGGIARPLNEQLRSLESRLPDYVAYSVDLPDAYTPVTQVYLQSRAAGDGPSTTLQAMLDPQTGEILGLRNRTQLTLDRSNFTRVIARLHYSLYLGDAMAWVFGLAALIWLLNHLFAPLLAFPVPKKWRNSFKIRREARGSALLLDLHRALTLWLFPVTLVLALSAIYLNWGSTFRAVVNTFAPITQEYDQTQPALAEPLFEPAFGFAEAIALAQTHAPGVEVDGLSYNARKGIYRVRFFDRRDVDPSVGRRRIFVDATQGSIMEDAHPVDGSASDLIMLWMFPLHSGKAFGWFGRGLILLAGCGMCLFVVSGVLLWLRRRRVRATPVTELAQEAKDKLPQHATNTSL